jgi:hypothetical protein
MFGHSEHFNDQPCEEGIDQICFTDDPQLRPTNWQVRLVEDKLIDPARLSKRFKHLPHIYLPEYDESLYRDNRLRLKQSASKIFPLLDRTEHSLVMFRHWLRDCVYDAAETILALGYDDPVRVREQMRFYRSLNYPARHGFDACGFLLRRHSNAQLARVNEDWQRQVLRYSKRDQLSWNVCAWMHNLRFVSLDLAIPENDFFILDGSEGRLPRDFDDETYLKMHADVASAGINPRFHFLHYGASEGRRYK